MLSKLCAPTETMLTAARRMVQASCEEMSGRFRFCPTKSPNEVSNKIDE